MLRDYLEPSVEMLLFAEDEVILTDSQIIDDDDILIEGGDGDNSDNIGNL